MVHILQVKEKDTAAFLRRCKAQGYSIVGLEQVTPPPHFQHLPLLPLSERPLLSNAPFHPTLDHSPPLFPSPGSNLKQDLLLPFP